MEKEITTFFEKAKSASISDVDFLFYLNLSVLASIDEIVECHRMAGDVDYLLKLVVRDIAHYDRIYRKLIAAVPDLADVSSTFSMERMKATTALPRPS